jgi:small subunit ribosomal protein S17
MIGRVVSTKMAKTAVILVESKKTHPLYGKNYAWTKRYMVDDPFGVKDGDIVVFGKVKPISKMKHWQISKVLGQDFVSLEQAELQEEAAEAIAEVMPEEEPEEKNEEVKEKAEEKKVEKAKKKVTKKLKGEEK